MNIEESILQDITDEYINSDTLLARSEWDTYEYNKLPVPRVTNIIKACNTNTEALLKWANSLGYRHKSHIKERSVAATKGTIIHNSIEDFIKTGKLPNYNRLLYSDDIVLAVQNGVDGFISFWGLYRYRNDIDKISMEQTIVTPYFGGTYDMLITLKDGRNLLYDFKTSNNITTTHFIQLSAYRYALQTYYNTHIDGVAILKIDKNKPLCNEYFIDLNDTANIGFINTCEKTFIGMLYTYYNMLNTQEQFNKIIKEIMV